jgi:iron complex outermembrane receptor protein
VISGYGLVNASLGVRSLAITPTAQWELFVWARNLLDKDCLQNVTVQAGNSGLIVGTPGDARSIGVTLRAKY